MSTDTAQLLQLLKEWGLSLEARNRLEDLKLTTTHLQTISADQLKEALPLKLIADRILLKQHLDKWRLNLKPMTQTAECSPAVSPNPPIAENASNSFHFSSNSPHSSSNSPSFSSNSPQYTSPPLLPLIPISNKPVKDTEINRSALLAILNSSPNGQTIIQCSNDTNVLHENHRQILTNLIVDTYISKRKKMSTRICGSWAREISKLFPSENALLYFSRRRIGVTGKIYERYRYCTHKLRYPGLLNAQRKMRKEGYPEVNKKIEDITEDEYLKQQAWLRENNEPWHEVMDKWKATTCRRLASYKERSLEESFKVWPLLKHCQANLLFDIDFSYLFPGKESLLLQSWNDFTTVFIEYFNSLKQISSAEYMEQYTKATNQDTKDYIIVMLLHIVLKPPAKIGTWRRSTITDAQQGNIVHLSDIADLDWIVEKKKTKYRKHGLQLKPFLVVVGKDIFNLESFHIYISNFCLKFDNLLQALDFCYKIFHVFNLEYPGESKKVWTFIQEHFFLTNNNKKNVEITEFISSLINFAG